MQRAKSQKAPALERRLGRVGLTRQIQPVPSCSIVSVMTKLNFDDPWQHHLHKVNEALLEADYSTAQARIHLLKRSSLLATTPRSREAAIERGDLEGALELVYLFPRLSIGYLWAGVLLVRACRYREAIEIYQRGVDEVVPEDDGRGHAILRYRLDEAKQYHDRRKDLLGLLPHEVVCLVLRHLSFTELVRCTGVSSTWRMLIFSWPSIWSSVHIDVSGDSGRHMVECLAQINRDKLRDLKLTSVHRDGMFGVERALRFLGQQSCHFLESIRKELTLFHGWKRRKETWKNRKINLRHSRLGPWKWLIH